MTRGRPPKRPRNITGLRNQPARSCESHPLNPEYPINHNTDPTGGSNSHDVPTGSPNDQPERELGLHPDSTRLPINHENTGIESDSSVEELSECAEGDDEGLQKNTPKLAVDRRDDSSDEDWLPSELKKKKQRIGERPNQYAKGPDVMSKSKRTQRRYREANHGQQMLDAFAFTTVRAARSAHEDGQGLLPVGGSAVDNQPGQVTIREESVQVEIPPIIDEERVES